jgi:hypothetical protein
MKIVKPFLLPQNFVIPKYNQDFVKHIFFVALHASYALACVFLVKY